MIRIAAALMCALALVFTVVSCGGGGDEATADKLTVVGAGS